MNKAYISPSPNVGIVGTGPKKENQMIVENSATAPKKGAHVSMDQQEGVFEVADINSLMQTANLKSTDGQGHITRNVPWTSIKPAK
jgi:hypothetical protein